MSDLISRSALIEKFKNSGILDSVDDAWVYSFAIAMIESTPTVEAKPVVRAKWDWGVLHKYPMCTSCQLESKDESDFCPNCGADMREKVNL